MDVIKIDIWSDIACPWCYIGKRKLEGGVSAFRERHPGAVVEVEYHSFELAPDTPADYEGSEIDFLTSHKGIPEPQARQMLAMVTKAAAEVGLDYDFEALRPTRTVKAHELLHYAKAVGRQVEAKERLMAAHFVEGRHVGRDEELADLAAEIGLDRDDVLRSLRDREHREAVRADKRQAAELGINAVPFFVFDGRYGVSGAQRPETFAQVLDQIRTERAAAAAA
jgi:predicted DsbA family dithiol-disulfide isomerase